jgi:PAS domain S-box-containing protein
MGGINVDIGKRKSLEHEIESLSMVAQKTANVVIITDKDRKIEWVNKAFEKVTGYSLDEVAGKSPGNFLQHEHSDPLLIAQMRKALNDGKPFRCELINTSKSGREYWIDIDIQPIFDEENSLTGFKAVQSDITQNKTLAEKLLTSEKTLKANLTQTPFVGIQWQTREGEIIFWNQASEKILGWKEEEVLGKNIDQVYTKEESIWFKEKITEVFRTGKPFRPMEWV